MTIPYAPAKAVFVGNNVAVDFPFAFRVWDANQLQVVITDPDDQSVTVTGWTVALTDNGGTVTFRKDGQPLPAGWKLAILRDMPFEQGVDLVNGTQFHPEVVETQMDVATAERQQLKEAVDRSIKVPPTNENPPELLADMLFEARDQTLASAAAAAASEQAAAGSAAEAAASAAEAAQTLTTATTVIGEAKADALDGIEAKRQAVMAEVTAEHGAALGDIARDRAAAVANIATDRAAAQTAIADDRSSALSAISDLANESVTTITRTGQLQVNAVQAAGAAIVATGDDIVRAVNAAGAAQVAKVAGTGAKARQDVVLEGDAQVARVSATGAEYVRQTYEEAQNAKGEADRAWAAADKAVSLAEVDYASATNGGLCPKVGEGLKVITLPDGSKRIDAITQVIAVSTPELTFPADVAVGFEYTLAMSAGTLIPGGRVVGYEVTVDGGETVELVADAEGIGKAMVTPVGVDLTTGNIAVLAIDSEGNRSKIAYRTFTKHAVVVRAPHILSPLEGDADVALLAAFQIQSFDIYGMASSGVATRLQVARDAAFMDVVFDSGENSAYATAVSMTDRLPDGVTLYARARHKAEIYGWSDWGQAVSFATVAITLKAPRIIAPIAGAVDQPVNVAVVLSAIETTGIAATPANTRVIVARDAALTDRVFDSLETGAYSTSVPTTGLPVNTELFVSGQHRDAELGWSALAAVRPFRTLNAYIEAPTITAPTAADGVELRPTFVFSAFANIGPVDSHRLTRFQVARDALFGDLLVDAVVSSGDRTKYAMTQDLPLFTQLYARVKYEGNTWGESAWSAVYVFKTLNAFVEKPAITSPAAGATGVGLRPAFTATAFANQGPADTAAGAHWQLSRNADFTDLVQEANGAYAATFTPSADLNIVTAYWARVKYRGVIWGESAWSDAVTFTTLNAFVEAPTVTAPTNGATGAALKPTITLSAFSNVGPADTHGGTRIQIATDAGFSNVVAEHNGAAVTEWTPGANLALNTQHYVRALYTGVKWGYSAWSGVVGFVTLQYTTPLGQTWLIRDSGTWVNPVPGGTYAIYAMGGGGGGGATLSVNDSYYAYMAGGGGGSGYAAYQQKTVMGNISILVGQGGAAGVGPYDWNHGASTTLQEVDVTVAGGQGGSLYNSATQGHLFGGNGGNGGGGGTSRNVKSRGGDGSDATGAQGGAGVWFEDTAMGMHYGGRGGNGAGVSAGLPAPQGGAGGKASTMGMVTRINGGNGGGGYGGGGGGGCTFSTNAMREAVAYGGKGGDGLTIDGAYLGGKGGSGGNYGSDGLSEIRDPASPGEKGGVLIKLVAYPA